MRYFSGFSPRLATSLVYMLQATEYNLGDYLAWFWRAPNLGHVQVRHQLKLTPKARLLLRAARAITLMVLLSVVILAAHAALVGSLIWLVAAALVLLAAPALTAYALAIPLWLGRQLIQNPRERTIIAAAASTIQNHPAFRIAIAGSYGKTTFKDTLATVLMSGRRVAATPGNMNTPLGISRFASRLTGEEQVLIFELGEYYPGDIRELCKLTNPQLGIITGINEAHLDKFKTLAATTATIFELADALPGGPVYKNGESPVVRKHAGDDPLLYTRDGVNGWHIAHLKISLDGTSFTATREHTTIHAHSRLLGAHQVGPLVAIIDIASRLGLTPQQIEDGLAATKPFEHRLEPRPLAGATLIDDTYNGNSDGIHAGLALLKAADARRRIYVTPGLVGQGSQTAAVHRHIGADIAPVADVVVLMQNSVTSYIQDGLKQAGFQGQLQIIADPVRFYANLDQFVAAGDVVLLQNDWPDNYA